MFEHKNNVREHFYCVQEMFKLYNTPELLDQLSKRPDLDTVCAADYSKMKNWALNGGGLKYADYHPEAQGIHVPKFE